MGFLYLHTCYCFFLVSYLTTDETLRAVNKEHRYLLAIGDECSKKVDTEPLKSKSAHATRAQSRREVDITSDIIMSSI